MRLIPSHLLAPAMRCRSHPGEWAFAWQLIRLYQLHGLEFKMQLIRIFAAGLARVGSRCRCRLGDAHGARVGQWRAAGQEHPRGGHCEAQRGQRARRARLGGSSEAAAGCPPPKADGARGRVDALLLPRAKQGVSAHGKASHAYVNLGIPQAHCYVPMACPS